MRYRDYLLIFSVVSISLTARYAYFNQKQKQILTTAMTSQLYQPTSTAETKFYSDQEEICDVNSALSLSSWNLDSTSLANYISNKIGSNELNQTINNQQTFAEFGESMIYYAIPFFVWVFILIFAFIYMLFALCFTKLCCIKRRYTKKQQDCCIAVLLFFTIVTIPLCFLTLVLDIRVGDYLTQTVCYGNFAYNGLLYGTNDTSAMWMGTTNIPPILQQIAGNISLVPENVGNIFKDSEWLENDPETLDSEIESMYGKYNGKLLASSNPKNDSPVQSMIFTNLGPISNNSTILGSLYTELNITSFFSSNLTNLKSLIDNIASETQPYIQTLNDAENNIANATNTIISYGHNINTVNSDINNNADSFREAAISFNGFIVLCCVFSFIVSCLINCTGFKWLRFLLHITWIALLFAAIASACIGTIYLAITIGLAEACPIASDVINDPNSYQYYPGLLSEDFVNQNYQCLYGNGSIATNYNFSFQLDNITQMANELMAQSSFISLINSTDIAQFILNELYQITNFTLYADVISNPNGIIFTLNTLNSWTSYTSSANQQNARCGNISQDFWTLSDLNCTIPEQVEFQKDDEANYDLGQPVCIATDNIIPNQINLRYNSTNFPNCNNSYIMQNTGYLSLETLVETYYQSIQMYQTNVSQTYQPFIEDMENYHDLNNKYRGNLTNMANNLVAFANSISNLTNLVANSQSDLTTSLNCSFVRDTLQLVQQSICINSMPATTLAFVLYYSLTICSFVASILTHIITLRMLSVNFKRHRPGMEPPSIEPFIHD